MGAGIIGSRVTPLLAARIEKGIELLCYNPNAVLIMSGGQGSGEDIPESKAMADYALDKGVGAKTKWYFTLNAFIREFVGYLRLTWKKHIIVIGIVVCIVIAWYG